MLVILSEAKDLGRSVEKTEILRFAQDDSKGVALLIIFNVAVY